MNTADHSSTETEQHATDASIPLAPESEAAPIASAESNEADSANLADLNNLDRDSLPSYNSDEEQAGESADVPAQEALENPIKAFIKENWLTFLKNSGFVLLNTSPYALTFALGLYSYDRAYNDEYHKSHDENAAQQHANQSFLPALFAILLTTYLHGTVLLYRYSENIRDISTPNFLKSKSGALLIIPYFIYKGIQSILPKSTSLPTSIPGIESLVYAQKIITTCITCHNPDNDNRTWGSIRMLSSREALSDLWNTTIDFLIPSPDVLLKSLPAVLWGASTLGLMFSGLKASDHAENPNKAMMPYLITEGVITGIFLAMTIRMIQITNTEKPFLGKFQRFLPSLSRRSTTSPERQRLTQNSYRLSGYGTTGAVNDEEEAAGVGLGSI